MKIRKLRKIRQELHGYLDVIYNSKGKKEHQFDPYTGEYFGYKRGRYKLRVTTGYGKAWKIK